MADDIFLGNYPDRLRPKPADDAALVAELRLFNHHRAADRIEELLRALEPSRCVCNVGVQDCPEHPGRLRTPLERILFEKAWDRRFRESRTQEGEGRG